MRPSEATTRGVQVRVESTFDPGRSAPEKSHWFFLYTVTITNNCEETVQLVSRHWVITNGEGDVEEVRAPGVVGKQPLPRGSRSATTPAVPCPPLSASCATPTRW